MGGGTTNGPIKHKRLPFGTASKQLGDAVLQLGFCNALGFGGWGVHTRFSKTGVPRDPATRPGDPKPGTKYPKEPPNQTPWHRPTPRAKVENVLSICKNRQCAVSAKDGRASKTGREGGCSIDR